MKPTSFLIAGDHFQVEMKATHVAFTKWRNLLSEMLSFATRTRRGDHRFIWGVVLAAVLLAMFPVGAKATCTFTSGTGTSAVTFAPPSTIIVSSSTPNNTILYTSPLIPPAIAPQITCTGNTTYGVSNSKTGGNPATNVYIYPTGISGLGYAITHDDFTTYLYPYGCCSLASGNYDASISSSLQLIKTGTIANGAVLPPGLLGYWQFATNKNVESFTLANSVTFISPSCTVNTNPINVTLPTVSTSALGTVAGATAGRTAFKISLACSSGSTLSIQLDPTTTSSGIPGVLTKTSGALTRVGVQLLDANGNAVALSSPTLVGATPNGPLNIAYFAQYYRTTTGAIMTGPIGAAATFTLIYQ